MAFTEDDAVAFSPVPFGGMGSVNSLSYTVHVLGEVARPGTYKILPSDRVTDLLRYAGNILPNGSQRNIQLKRQNQSRKIDIYSYKYNGDLNQNPYLVDNDVVFVPLKKGEFEIEGPVNRPGNYEISQPISLSKAIKMAGGLATGYTSTDPIRIIRFGMDGTKNVIEVSSSDKIDYDFKVQKGDIVVVPHILLVGKKFDYNVSKIPGDNIFYPTINDNVNVIGAVTAPGAYSFQPSFKYLDYVGLAGPTHQSSLKRVKVLSGDGKKRLVSNVKEINPGDTIIVPTKSITVTNALTWFNTITNTTLTTLLLYDRLHNN
ncbi:SLBB domain-containing protein [bacterium]|nr:SLBB domain-containing protein [bacterium]